MPPFSILELNKGKATLEKPTHRKAYHHPDELLRVGHLLEKQKQSLHTSGHSLIQQERTCIAARAKNQRLANEPHDLIGNSYGHYSIVHFSDPRGTIPAH